jgi:hypothetical protein
MFVRSTPLRVPSRKFILLPPREMCVQFHRPEPPPPSLAVSFNATMPATPTPDAPPSPSEAPAMRIPVE